MQFRFYNSTSKELAMALDYIECLASNVDKRIAIVNLLRLGKLIDAGNYEQCEQIYKFVLSPELKSNRWICKKGSDANARTSFTISDDVALSEEWNFGEKNGKELVSRFLICAVSYLRNRQDDTIVIPRNDEFQNELILAINRVTTAIEGLSFINVAKSEVEQKIVNNEESETGEQTEAFDMSLLDAGNLLSLDT